MRARLFTLLLACCLSVVAWADTAPVGQWDFNEGEGEVLHDKSGNNNHGKINGATWVKTAAGAELSLDGVDDYVTLPAIPSFYNAFNPPTWTIEMWVQPGRITSGVKILFDKPYIAHTMPYYQIRFGLQMENGRDKDYGVQIIRGDSGKYLYAYGPADSAVEGEWAHLAATFDLRVTTLTLYKNGIKIAQMTTPTAPSPGYANYKSGAALGRLLNGSSYHFNGSVDEVSVYDQALSEEEIKKHYLALVKEKETTTGKQVRIETKKEEVEVKGKLVAAWNFNEGTGDILHDQSGNNNDGKIHGAKWVKCGKGHALAFGRSGSYVDFGDNPSLKIAGDMTMSAWVKLTASPFPDGSTNWHIMFCEAYRKSGFSMRLAGTTAKLYFRSSQQDTFQHGIGNVMLQKDVFYHVVAARKGNTMTFYIDGAPDARFSVNDPAPGPTHFTISQESQSFHGWIDDMRVYDKALSVSEILGLYKGSAGNLGKDTSWFGKIKLTPFFRFDEKNLILEADLRGVLPLKAGQQAVVELAPTGGKPLAVREVREIPDSGKVDFEFALGQLADAEYEVRVAVNTGAQTKTLERISFHYPPLPVVVAPPGQKTVSALPPPVQPVQYGFNLLHGGGFRINIKGQSYPVESSYSFPHGGENKLLAAAEGDQTGEPSWRVTTKKVNASTFRVTASGKHYRINREIELQPTRVQVQDTITNVSTEDVGIMLSNHINFSGKPEVQARTPVSYNPPGYIYAKDHGLGILPLDDVYQVQQRTHTSGGLCAVRSNSFGLARGASYTLEWAVYPIGTADYYDLINVMRKDLGLDNRTVDGGLTITHSGKWLRESPPGELVEFGGLQYASSGCVTHVADDPGISIEGIEFLELPKERAALKQTYIEMKKRFPGIKVMFHIAYNIYATNKPEETFPDSRLMARSGKHEMYNNSLGYFSEERRAQGWAWYPYYPTLENSFGKALLRSVDVMMDEIGVDGVFGDGLLTGYGPGRQPYPTSFVATYDKWDGHTVEIDPGTKTIRKKLGVKSLLGREALIAYIRKINAKGGLVVINHMNVVPRSFAREKAIYCAETNDGDYRCASLHLSPTVMGLANPDKFRSVQAIYDDIRGKLSWGALYIYYWWGGASHLTHKMITTEMYPITVTDIRSGTITGRERIITLHSGVYGWRDDRSLHCAVLADARGRLVPGSFLTTVDRSGVRTQIDLNQNETVVLKRIPVTLQSNSTVNTVVTQYDASGIQLALNGKGAATLQVKDGIFPIKPGAAYVVKTDAAGVITADKHGTLSFTVTLGGQMIIQIDATKDQ